MHDRMNLARCTAQASAAVAFAALLAHGAWAHTAETAETATAAGPIPWTFEPWVIGTLGLSAALYAAGVARLWRKAGVDRGIHRGHAAAFAAGWLVLVLALVSPLDALGGRLFSAHMMQHELLMVMAAPLMVLSRPLAVWAWGLPAAWRRPLGRLGQQGPSGWAWRALSFAPAAWVLHAVVLWGWHAPVLFEAALASNAVHTLQHISFFVTALLFWWAPLGSSSRAGSGASMVYLFTTMVHTGALGALMTLAPRLWYAPYAATSAALGFDPLEDQQIGGLIMWIPAGLAYLVAGLAVVGRMLQDGRAAQGRGV